MRWLTIILITTGCAGQHSFPTYKNFNKKCYYQHSIDWSACEDKFKAMEDMYNGEMQLWQYKRTF